MSSSRDPRKQPKPQQSAVPECIIDMFESVTICDDNEINEVCYNSTAFGQEFDGSSEQSLIVNNLEQANEELKANNATLKNGLDQAIAHIAKLDEALRSSQYYRAAAEEEVLRLTSVCQQQDHAINNLQTHRSQEQVAYQRNIDELRSNLEAALSESASLRHSNDQLSVQLINTTNDLNNAITQCQLSEDKVKALNENLDSSQLQLQKFVATAKTWENHRVALVEATGKKNPEEAIEHLIIIKTDKEYIQAKYVSAEEKVSTLNAQLDSVKKELDSANEELQEQKANIKNLESSQNEWETKNARLLKTIKDGAQYAEMLKMQKEEAETTIAEKETSIEEAEKKIAEKENSVLNAEKKLADVKQKAILIKKRLEEKLQTIDDVKHTEPVPAKEASNSEKDVEGSNSKAVLAPEDEGEEQKSVNSSVTRTDTPPAAVGSPEVPETTDRVDRLGDKRKRDDEDDDKEEVVKEKERPTKKANI